MAAVVHRILRIRSEALAAAIDGGEGSTADPSVANVVRHGADDVVLSINSYGSGSASNTPNPIGSVGCSHRWWRGEYGRSECSQRGAPRGGRRVVEYQFVWQR